MYGFIRWDSILQANGLNVNGPWHYGLSMANVESEKNNRHRNLWHPNRSVVEKKIKNDTFSNDKSNLCALSIWCRFGVTQTKTRANTLTFIHSMDCTAREIAKKEREKMHK